jgi:hypothetical protein
MGKSLSVSYSNDNKESNAIVQKGGARINWTVIEEAVQQGRVSSCDEYLGLQYRT